MNISKQQAHAILTGMYDVITKNPDLEDAEFEEISHFALAYILAEVESLAPRPWICPDLMLPPSSEEVLVYPMPSGVSYTAFHDGDVWRSTEYEYNYGYNYIALPDGYIKGWMPLPKIPE